MEMEGATTMRTMKIATLVCTLTLAGSATQANEQTATVQKPSQTAAAKPTCSPVSSVEFSQAIDAWRMACLAGEDKLASEGEKNLMTLIDRDLKWCANTLEQFDGDDKSTSPDKTVATNQKDGKNEEVSVEDTMAWEIFSAKKQLARNIRHTNAFSNKYRLLGDYEDLIKREKSADRAGVPLDMQEKGETALREAGK
jgi:hypothetical protein